MWGLGEEISFVPDLITHTINQLNESIATGLRGGSQMKQAFTLGGRSKKTFTYDIRAMRRGYYQLGPGQITAGDLFGFKENR